jgi:hypothetical protein
MKAVIRCQSPASFDWFLDRCRVALVHPTWIDDESAFPVGARRYVSGGHFPDVDLAVVHPEAFALLARRAPRFGDEVYVIRGRCLIGLFREPPSSRAASLLEAMFPGAPPEPARGERYAQLARLLFAARGHAPEAPSEPDPGPRSAPSPFQVLGVGPDASLAEVEDAKRRRVWEYHPDRVAHLGEKLRDIADEETRRILDAYEKARRIAGRR